MYERTTLRSHLNRFASQAPQGAAIGEVIEAVAAAAVDLAALLADGPLAGITGQNGGINSDGDRQKDIDVAAHEIMRCALRDAPVAAILSGKRRCRNLPPQGRCCIDPLDGSANRKQYFVSTIFRSARGKDLLSTF
jgi:fructose-1,6-bisphosphatase I